eukprot:5365970-Pyramimonas_sp.AAC.2
MLLLGLARGAPPSLKAKQGGGSGNALNHLRPSNNGLVGLALSMGPGRGAAHCCTHVAAVPPRRVPVGKEEEGTEWERGGMGSRRLGYDCDQHRRSPSPAPP